MRRRSSLAASALLVLTFALSASPAAAQDLSAPPPMTSTTTSTTQSYPTDTTRRLDEAEQKDSGRNFELVWIDASAGASYIDMQQFSNEKLSLAKSQSAGPAFSLGAGIRLVIFVAGLRARYNALSSFDLWQLNAEAGLKIPISKVDILFTGHGGYSTAGRLGDAGLSLPSTTASAADDVAVRGFNAGLDFAVDYYITPLFSVGAGVIGDFLFLKRPKLDAPPGFASLSPAQQAEITSSPLYSAAGSSAGFQFGGGLRLGLHLGL